MTLFCFIRTFPWMIEIFNISPYHFVKVIEVFIKAEDGLSRDVVKHLNYVRIILQYSAKNIMWSRYDCGKKLKMCDPRK